MSIEEGYKRLAAEGLAAGLEFEWDYENAADCDLYEAIEAMGYEWDGKEFDGSWIAPGAQRTNAKSKKPRKRRANEQELLRQWNAGEKKPGGLGPR